MIKALSGLRIIVSLQPQDLTGFTCLYTDHKSLYRTSHHTTIHKVSIAFNHLIFAVARMLTSFCSHTNGFFR